jgi:transposase-like protein
MSINRIQFQPGLSLADFLKNYGTEAQCETILEHSRWPQGFVCPKCGTSRAVQFRRGRSKIFQCCGCRKQVSLISGTIFHGSNLPLTQWFLAIYFITQGKSGLSMLELRRMLGLSYKAAWRLKHKLMQAMFEREETTVLAQRVEIDDAYLGGERSGGKVGRGSENKVPFIAAVETSHEGHPLRAVFSRVTTFSSHDVDQWAKSHLAPTALVVSDGLNCFRAVTKTGCSHQREVVGDQRRSTNMGCFHWINTILGNLKTAMAGTYHAFDFDKYAHRYLAEFQYRFNRRFDLRSMLPRLVFACVSIGKRPEAWLRQAENWT